MTRHWIAGALSLALVAGCADSATAPRAGPELDPAELAAATQSASEASAPERDGVAGLRKLARRALGKIARDEGEEAARARFAALHTLLEEARAAREAGNRELVIEKLRAAHLEMAQIVTEAFGAEPAERATALLGNVIGRMNARIDRAEANGRDVTRARELVAALSELHASANNSLAQGEPAAALDAALRGLERVRALVHRRSSD